MGDRNYHCPSCVLGKLFFLKGLKPVDIFVVKYFHIFYRENKERKQDFVCKIYFKIAKKN